MRCIWIGRGDDALRRAEALVELASAAGDRVGELCGRIQAGTVELYRGAERATEELAALVEQALPVFQAAGDDLALYLAYSALSEVAEIRGRWDAGWRPSSGPSLMLGGRATYRPAPRGGRAASRFFGTTPVAELLAWLDEHEPTSRAGPVPARLSGRSAGDAGALRRGARDPRPDACGTGGARWRDAAREHHRVRVRRRRAAGRRSRGRGRVRVRGIQAARGGWGTDLPVGRGGERREGAVRARPARRGRSLGRPRGRARRERDA